MSGIGNSDYGKYRNYEKGRHDESRHSIFKSIVSEIESTEREKERQEKRKADAQKYGTNGNRTALLRGIGRDDRFNAHPYEPERYENLYDKANYEAGFKNNGNLKILGNLETLTPEQLIAIGENDYISGILLNEVPQAVVDNKFYMQGYTTALLTSDIKGKGRR